MNVALCAEEKCSKEKLEVGSVKTVATKNIKSHPEAKTSKQITEEQCNYSCRTDNKKFPKPKNVKWLPVAVHDAEIQKLEIEHREKWQFAEKTMHNMTKRIRELEAENREIDKNELRAINLAMKLEVELKSKKDEINTLHLDIITADQTNKEHEEENQKLKEELRKANLQLASWEPFRNDGKLRMLCTIELNKCEKQIREAQKILSEALQTAKIHDCVGTISFKAKDIERLRVVLEQEPEVKP